MHERPEQVVPPARPGPDETGEVGSEGGSSGDMLLPSVKPDRAGADPRPGAVPALLWWAVLVPVAAVLLWFLTSLGSR